MRNKVVQDEAAFEKLVKKAIRRNREATEDLCRTIAKRVLFHTTHKLKSRTDAEDVAQEVLIRVCSKIHELKEPKAFYGWLNTIIINETNRYRTKNYKYDDVLDMEEYADFKMEEDEEFLPQEYISREDLRKTVMESIDRLPERQLEAVMMHYYDELSLTETAKIMGVSVARVSQCLALAREKIKSEINKEIGQTTTVSGISLMPT